MPVPVRKFYIRRFNKKQEEQAAKTENKVAPISQQERREMIERAQENIDKKTYLNKPIRNQK